ncbi:MAG: TPM domain-containing protein [Clostridia bacterium]|nr:TPM domain-containing protein [Clostridia bacterium]
MKKKIVSGALSLLIVTFILACTGVSAFAESGLPKWFPDDPKSFERYHDEDQSRVIDNADILTASEEMQLKLYLSQMKKDYDCDFVFLSEDRVNENLNSYYNSRISGYDEYDYNSYRQYYSADYYDFNGFGVGDDYNGIILYVNMTPGKRGWYTCASGAAEDMISERIINKIDDRLYEYMSEGDYGEGIINYYKDFNTLYKKGNLLFFEDIFHAFQIGLVPGVIVSLLVLGIVTAKMKTVKQAVNANNYFVKNSFHCDRAQDLFLYRSVTRTKIEKNKGGGGSSFSSGFSGSSGSSHSGGGRSF